MVNTYIQPKDVYSTWLTRFENNVKLAENTDTGITIWLNSDSRFITVLDEEMKTICEREFSFSDVEKIARKLYDKYLELTVNDFIVYESNPDIEMLIEAREAELFEATDNLVRTIMLEDIWDLDDEDIEDCQEAFIKFMVKKYNANIYRPTIIDEELCEYPYKKYLDSKEVDLSPPQIETNETANDTLSNDVK